MNDFKVLAISFDGTLVDDEYPNIGTPKKEIVKLCKRWKAEGNKLILWTSREGNHLEKAIALCNLLGLFFDAVNDNLPELIEKYGGNPRKVFADFYLDDRNVTQVSEDKSHLNYVRKNINLDTDYEWINFLRNDERENDNQ